MVLFQVRVISPELPASKVLAPFRRPGESKVLSLQHHLLTKRWDSKLIVSPTSIQSSAIWLLDVSRNVECTVSLHWIGIEAKQFPSQPPRNVTLSIGSLLSMPSIWTNSLDLVSQRLLITAVRRREWPVALSERFRVLKPGGWAQRGEIGKTHLPGPKTRQHQSLLSKPFAHRDILLDCANQLPAMLIEAGFTDVRMETRLLPLGKVGGADGENARKNFMGVYRGMKTPVLKAGELGFFDAEMEGEWDTRVYSVLGS
ncbi:hypothetical protein JB92DRAFT_3082814 [Gautieria morchelliformis]|nr:hypothetical protein JB92DRAFT_3082814 [Gautieria morchelliformis]